MTGTKVDTTYTFMTINVKLEDGSHAEDKYFLGPLPKEGDALELVFVGRDEKSGGLRIQLRARE